MTSNFLTSQVNCPNCRQFYTHKLESDHMYDIDSDLKTIKAYTIEA